MHRQRNGWSLLQTVVNVVEHLLHVSWYMCSSVYDVMQCVLHGVLQCVAMVGVVGHLLHDSWYMYSSVCDVLQSVLQCVAVCCSGLCCETSAPRLMVYYNALYM